MSFDMEMICETCGQRSRVPKCGACEMDERGMDQSDVLGARIAELEAENARLRVELESGVRCGCCNPVPEAAADLMYDVDRLGLLEGVDRASVRGMAMEIIRLRKGIETWQKVTGRMDPETLDLELGRAGIDHHLSVIQKLYYDAQANAERWAARVKVLEARQDAARQTLEGRR